MLLHQRHVVQRRQVHVLVIGEDEHDVGLPPVRARDWCCWAERDLLAGLRRYEAGADTTCHRARL